MIYIEKHARQKISFQARDERLKIIEIDRIALGGFVAQSLPAYLGRHGKLGGGKAWRGVWADHECIWRVKETKSTTRSLLWRGMTRHRQGQRYGLKIMDDVGNPHS